MRIMRGIYKQIFDYSPSLIIISPNPLNGDLSF